MRAIDSTTKFKQDFKRELRGKHKKFLETSFESLLTKLAMDQKLEPKYRDHSLTGNWKDFRDCHLKPDLVLLYRKDGEDSLILVRLGSHSELAL